jgi:hypothetical protein
MVHTGHAGPTDHSGCSPGHSGHFGGSHVMITKLRKFSKIGLWSYFGGPYVMYMKEWFARVETLRDLLSDLRAFQNRRHFGSNMFRATCAKHGFLQTNHNSIF